MIVVGQRLIGKQQLGSIGQEPVKDDENYGVCLNASPNFQMIVHVIEIILNLFQADQLVPVGNSSLQQIPVGHISMIVGKIGQDGLGRSVLDRWCTHIRSYEVRLQGLEIGHLIYVKEGERVLQPSG